MTRWALLILCLGCARGERVVVDPGVEDHFLSFLVVVDADGAVQRLSDPFQVASGRVSFGRRNFALVNPGEGHQVLQVSLSRAELGGGVLEGRLADAMMRIDADFTPSQQDELRNPKVMRLPLDVRTLRIDLEDGSLEAVTAGDYPGLQTLVVEVPWDPGHCGPQEPPGPYAAELKAFPFPDNDDEKPATVLPVDDDHVLMALRHGVGVVRRGGVRTDWLRSGEDGPEGFYTDGVKTDDGRFLLVGRGTRDSGQIVELSVADGRITNVQTTTSGPGLPSFPELWACDYDVNRRTLFAGGTEGFLVAFDDNGVRAVSPPPELVNAGNRITALAIDPDGDPPHAVGTVSGVVARGDMSTGTWVDTTMLQVTPGEVADLDFGDDGELWAGGRFSTFSRLPPGGDWERKVDFDFPQSVFPCSDGVVNLQATIGTLTAVAVTDQAVLISVNVCSALLRYDRTTGCVSTVPRPLDDIALTSFSNRRITRAGDEILVAVDGGDLWRFGEFDE